MERGLGAGHADPEVTWFLYVIECADGSLYTGIAIDPKARYDAHVAGKGARYTRSHPPVKLLMTEPHPDRSSASKAEYAFKQLPASEKRRLAGRRSCRVRAAKVR
jgi:putative endonuclease